MLFIVAYFKRKFCYLVINGYIIYIETEQGIFEQVLQGDLDFSSDPWPNISEDAKDLVRRMLIRDPKRRLTAHEVLCKSCLLVSLKLIKT